MILPYIINAALVLGACLVFYKLLLRRETFYTMNRWLLIVCLFISFALPLLRVPQQFSLRKKENSTLVQQVAAGSTAPVVQQTVKAGPPATVTPAGQNIVSAPPSTIFS